MGCTPNFADLLFRSCQMPYTHKYVLHTILWKPLTASKNSTLDWHVQRVGLGVRSLEPGPGSLWLTSSTSF